MPHNIRILVFEVKKISNKYFYKVKHIMRFNDIIKLIS